ncbi:MAG: hypothetical protein BWZ10_01898 [candidate division BRC1 bacterium ADurb.BinA364]|nr:MAG: hypothetical protein BWZ10_01898 [candidate division BRC1 bacterium ADurb.BinA364]
MQRAAPERAARFVRFLLHPRIFWVGRFDAEQLRWDWAAVANFKRMDFLAAALAERASGGRFEWDISSLGGDTLRRVHPGGAQAALAIWRSRLFVASGDEWLDEVLRSSDQFVQATPLDDALASDAPLALAFLSPRDRIGPALDRMPFSPERQPVAARAAAMARAVLESLRWAESLQIEIWPSGEVFRAEARCTPPGVVNQDDLRKAAESVKAMVESAAKTAHVDLGGPLPWEWKTETKGGAAALTMEFPEFGAWLKGFAKRHRTR